MPFMYTTNHHLPAAHTLGKVWIGQATCTLCPQLQQSHSTLSPCSSSAPHVGPTFSELCLFFGLRALARAVPSSENALQPYFCLMKTSNMQSTKISVESQTLGMEH